MERKISLKSRPDYMTSYTVKPSRRSGGYPGSAPAAPPPGAAGVGGYPAGANPVQSHNAAPPRPPLPAGKCEGADGYA